MKWVLTALVLGIFLNMSSAGGNAWPIGSVVAVVIMGIYIKSSQDRHFEEIKRILKGQNCKEDTHPSADETCAGTE